MYWETLFPESGFAASPLVEECAKWVQWAYTGIMSGASENEDDIRYNLNQFWQLERSGFQAENNVAQGQLLRLDATANGLLNALDTGKIYSASPDYWSFWKTFMFGGTPGRPESAAAAEEARSAAIAAAEASKAAGQNEMASFFQQQAAKVDTDLKNSNAMWNRDGLSLGGIPVWAIALLGIGVLFLVSRR